MSAAVPAVPTGPPPDDVAVTVVIITRNRRTELLRTLAHMTALPDAAPIVVVDNGSTDATTSAVQARFPEVRVFGSEHNLGALGRNRAVEDIDTRYVAFCDDDTRWQPGALDLAVRTLDRHPELASVTGRCLVEPDLREDPITPELRDSPVPGPDWLPGPALLGVLAGLSVFRVTAFLGVGGFSERIWFCGEEELLAIDLAAAGWWMCWLPDMVIHHAPSRDRDPRPRRVTGLRNTWWTLWLRRPVRSAVRRSMAILRSAPRDTGTLRALASALRGLPWVLRERRVVPPEVEDGLRLLEDAQRRSTARRYVG